MGQHEASVELAQPESGLDAESPLDPTSTFDGHWRLAAMAVGVLIVAISYAYSRPGNDGSSVIFWVGQLVIFVSAASVALSARLTARAATLMVLAFGVATALTKWMYSPLQLKFPDELQHLLGTANLMHNDAFGLPNRTLEISTRYPGLETVAAVVCRVTGLSIDAAGLLLGGLFHVAAVCLVSVLMRRMTGSVRAGAIATVAYGCNASFGFFNSMFIYENLSLVFAFVALLCVMSIARTADRGPRVVRGVVAILTTIATIVSHHVTALGLCAALVVFSFVAVRRRRAGVAEGGAWRTPVVIAVAAIALTMAWFSLVATQTWSYIEPYTVGFIGNTAKPASPRPGTGERLVLPSGAPKLEVAFAGLGLLVLLLLCLAGGLIEWRRARRFRLVYLVGAAGLAALEVGRLVSGRGSEVAGRSAVFLYIPVAAAVGLAVPLVIHRLTANRRMLMTSALSLAWVSAILIAWPVWWNRMPGGSLIATQFERGNDAAENAAGTWAKGAIAKNQPIAGDSGGLIVLTTRAGLVGVSNMTTVFYAPTLSRGLRAQLTERNVRYAWVNTKLPRTTSVDGSYYGAGSVYTTAPTAAALAKFDHTSGVDPVYDNGEIKIYDLIGFESQ